MRLTGKPVVPLAPTSIEVGAAHEIVATRASEFALLVVQFVTAAWTPTPRLARRIRCGFG